MNAFLFDTMVNIEGSLENGAYNPLQNYKKTVVFRFLRKWAAAPKRRSFRSFPARPMHAPDIKMRPFRSFVKQIHLRNGRLLSGATD